ncbi:MAG: biosynthetic arginine decarboxylase [Thermoanaerobaculia bacterium]
MTEPRPAAADWTLADAVETYQIDGWGNDYVSINERGHLVVQPGGPGTPGIDLKALVDELQERGIGLPILIRFSDLLKARLDELHTAFAQAIEEYGYGAGYRGVYPIKVNQDRYVVETLLAAGRRWNFGLEAGSKPELLAVMAMLDDPQAVIVCNGYKDEEYVETALLASRLGPKVFIVVEKFSELALITRVAERTGVAPTIGVRARLATRGAGHWQASAGDRSKFGLSGRRLVEAFHFLEAHGLLDRLQLLHFHLGSQVSSIRAIKEALNEAARIYVDLKAMGAPLGYLDVGGGLGVDYDGSQSDSVSSINYTLQEYANDVVAVVMEVCDLSGVAHPTLISESGRALVAHHAALVMGVLGVKEFRVGELPVKPPVGSAPSLRGLFECHQDLDEDNFLEIYHDARDHRDACLSLFTLGHLSLAQRGLAEELFSSICLRILQILRRVDEVPDELVGLAEELADAYFLNFSVFQSLPDSWAIEQLFPVLPIHRLDEPPTRQAVLTDITCDSDGCIDRFIDRREDKRLLEVHEFTGEPYYFAAFLVGAYQEILGDLHNLFGDTHAINVSLDSDGGYEIEELIKGDTVTEVLRYVQYDPEDLVRRVRRSVERAARQGTMSLKESSQLMKLYEEGLAGYTYLEGE